MSPPDATDAAPAGSAASGSAAGTPISGIPRTPSRAHPQRTALILLALLALLATACLLRLIAAGNYVGWPGLGPLLGSFWAVLAGPWGSRLHLFSQTGLLVTDVVLACVAGAALASGGVALQALLRNPLAEPFILGLSGGAGLGIVLQQWLARTWEGARGPGYVGAFNGAALIMTLVFLAGRRKGVIDRLGLLLAGVVLSSVCGAIIMTVLYLDGRGSLDVHLARWMMGHLEQTVAGKLWFTFLVGAVMAGIAALIVCGRAMDVATFSDAEAQSLGVNLPRLRTTLFIAASVLAAAAVVVAGPLAFVGLICPHLARLLLGPSHRPLVIGAALLGATLIVLADTAGEALDRVFQIGNMPIGIFTALVGGPAFLWMLRPQLGRGGE